MFFIKGKPKIIFNFKIELRSQNRTSVYKSNFVSETEDFSRLSLEIETVVRFWNRRSTWKKKLGLEIKARFWFRRKKISHVTYQINTENIYPLISSQWSSIFTYIIYGIISLLYRLKLSGIGDISAFWVSKGSLRNKLSNKSVFMITNDCKLGKLFPSNPLIEDS